MSLIHRRRGMIAEHLQGNTLLGHGHNCLLVHVRIVNAHAAEYGECLHKVLIVLGEVLWKERQISFILNSNSLIVAYQLIELVDQLYHSNDLSQRVFDGHAEYGAMLETGILIDTSIETIILVSIGHIHSFTCCGHMTSDANVDGEP